MTRSVLIADDDRSLSSLMTLALTRAGYDVATADNGQAALDLLKKRTFDGLITDVVMPDMDGLELIRAVRAREDRMAIVAVSGGGTAVTMDFLPSAKAFGADETLRKPVRMPELVQTLADVIARRHRC